MWLGSARRKTITRLLGESRTPQYYWGTQLHSTQHPTEVQWWCHFQLYIFCSSYRADLIWPTEDTVWVKLSFRKWVGMPSALSLGLMCRSTCYGLSWLIGSWHISGCYLHCEHGLVKYYSLGTYRTCGHRKVSRLEELLFKLLVWATHYPELVTIITLTISLKNQT